MLAVATALLLMPLPGDRADWSRPALLHDLQNLLHFPTFALLASVAFRALRARFRSPDRKPHVIVMAAAAVFALATEGLQALVGREPAWQDLLLDLLGAGLALLLHVRAEIRHADAGQQAGTGLLLGAITIGLVATGQFLWTAAAYTYRADQLPVIWRADSLLLSRFSHWQGEGYPGLVIDEPPPDWQAWNQLEVRIRNRGNLALPVVVRVHDRSHDLGHQDRYNGTFMLQPASIQTLRILLEEVRTAPAGRAMDLGAIRGLIIYGPDPAGQARAFDVAEVRLGR